MNPSSPVSIRIGVRPRRAHLIGVRGAGMQSLAQTLSEQGWRVAGSDADDRGHARENISPKIDLVVYSMAIPEGNCERRRADQLGLPTLSYPQMLGQLMAGHDGVAVAGTHGKSTTTGMAAGILIAAGLDPTVVCGARPMGAVTGGRAGSGPVLVEACEYRQSFLNLRPRVAAVLNVESDHFDCYRNTDELHAAFAEFARNVNRNGTLVVNAACRASMLVSQHAACRRVTFAIDRAATWQTADLAAQRGAYQFQLLHEGRDVGRVRLAVFGRHNVANALAAAAIAHAAGADNDSIRDGLVQFRGIRRRLETAGQFGGIRWIDDYAHHPTEIAASLAALREMRTTVRLWCVFQPHQASRTEALFDQFAASLENVDRLFVAPILGVREENRGPARVEAADLARAVHRRGIHASSFCASDQVVESICQSIGRSELTPGDILVTMGAGDIGKVGHDISQRIGIVRTAG